MDPGQRMWRRSSIQNTVREAVPLGKVGSPLYMSQAIPALGTQIRWERTKKIEEEEEILTDLSAPTYAIFSF